MEMQDKEFDKLFSTKLDDFEVEPSKTVWQGINNGLGNNRRKKFVPFLGIAASIIVLIAAGVVFLTQKTTVVKPHWVKDRVAANHPAKITPSTIMLKPQTAILQRSTIAAASVIKPKHIANSNAVTAPAKQDIATQQQAPAQSQQQPILASAAGTKNDAVKPAIIDTVTVLAAVPAVHMQPVKPTLATATIPPIEKTTDVPPAKKHRIRSLGDILNVVIATVDKRKDKVIEFSDTDDDESSITGVNLGIIRIKKQN